MVLHGLDFGLTSLFVFVDRGAHCEYRTFPQRDDSVSTGGAAGSQMEGF